MGVPLFERSIVDSGIILLKYWLEVSPEEQTRRLESRIHDGRKIWKLTAMDLKSYNRWDDYTKARDDMFAASDTSWAPWYMAQLRRQEARAPERHQPPAGTRAVRRAAERKGHQAAETPDRQEHQQLPVPGYRREVLMPWRAPLQRCPPRTVMAAA